jgi:hypothetical protein
MKLVDVKEQFNRVTLLTAYDDPIGYDEDVINAAFQMFHLRAVTHSFRQGNTIDDVFHVHHSRIIFCHFNINASHVKIKSI